jgi:hypothetical protein
MGSHFNVSWFWTNTDIENILKILPTCNKPIFHICSGVSWIGDYRVDRTIINAPILKERDERRSSANIIGDMNRLPFKSGIAGSVICDPPYDYDFTDETLITELIRICKPKGKIIFIAPWVPNSPIIKIVSTSLWVVGNRPYFKIMSIMIKINGQIGDYA